MDKENMIHPYNGILPSNRKEQTIDKCNNTDESQGHYAEWKKKTPVLKRLHTVLSHLYNNLEMIKP